MVKNRGISLIVLVITIIVIIILAGTVILSLSSNNPINQATEAVFKANVDSYISELTIVVANQYLNDYSFNISTFNKSVWIEGDIQNTIKEVIPSITDEDARKFKVQNGQLVYVSSNTTEKSWLEEIGVRTGTNIVSMSNTTMNGAEPSYNNPVIPKGFKAINDGAVWPDDWNSGLVIEDENGNQFVWIPVDGINILYEKWCDQGLLYNNINISDDVLPDGINNEMDQITKYGGFYIARFEAGKQDADTLVSKKNATVWTNITYTDAKSNSEAMYNNNEVKSGLVTGTQWDTAMKWLDNSGNYVTDSRTWGNFNDSLDPANVTGYGLKQVTGFSENWKANNIYDLAGNTWEWTNENYGTDRIYRGGRYMDSGLHGPAAYRYYNNINRVYDFISYRVALYIL